MAQITVKKCKKVANENLQVINYIGRTGPNGTLVQCWSRYAITGSTKYTHDEETIIKNFLDSEIEDYKALIHLRLSLIYFIHKFKEPLEDENTFLNGLAKYLAKLAENRQNSQIWTLEEFGSHSIDRSQDRSKTYKASIKAGLELIPCLLQKNYFRGSHLEFLRIKLELSLPNYDSYQICEKSLNFFLSRMKEAEINQTDVQICKNLLLIHEILDPETNLTQEWRNLVMQISIRSMRKPRVSPFYIDSHTLPTKIKHPRYNVLRMYVWDEYVQPTVRLQQNIFEKTVIEVSSLHL